MIIIYVKPDNYKNTIKPKLLSIDIDNSKNKPKLLSEMEYTQYNKFPIYTKEGIKVLKLPSNLRSRLTEVWRKNRVNRKIEATDKHKGQYVVTNHGKSPTYMVDIDEKLKKELEKFILDELVKWTGISTLEHTATYGIREYTRNSFLANHVDRYDTHIMSAIINVGQIGVEEPWALTVQSRALPTPQDIIFDNGFDVALYESSTLMHGRPTLFKGEVYANLFIHYAPSDWSEQLKELNL
jgi:prolyl 4-hydroxylase